ncbi:MAG TPA: hypothetical protein VIX18_01645, partial [Nitrospirota bacterium]
MKKGLVLMLSEMLLIMAVAVGAGCSPATSGAVKDDTTLTETSRELKTISDVSDYKGPKLRV